MSIRFRAALIVFVILNTGCSSSTQGEVISTPTILVPTPTLPATSNPLPSETPQRVSPPTIAPVDGITTTQVNVRIEPFTASSVLGVLPADMRIEITGKDPTGNWWQINYPHPEAVDGKGWVTAQYITLPSAVDVPTVGGAEADRASGPVAVIQQQLNVRSGPGTGFNSLGTLNPQDVVSLSGKDPSGAWLQIEFPTGPEGKGWVNAAFVQAQGVEKLPIIAESGAVIGTGTPTGIPPTPTPTVIPAPEDRDSAESPIVSVTLDLAGTQTLIYSGDLSSPHGDREDWVAFRPYDRFVFVHLECTGSDALEMQLLENVLPVDTYVKCGAPVQRLAVNAGSQYLFHLRAASPAGTLQYTTYTLTIKARP